VRAHWSLSLIRHEAAELYARLERPDPPRSIFSFWFFDAWHLDYPGLGNTGLLRYCVEIMHFLPVGRCPSPLFFLWFRLGLGPGLGITRSSDFVLTIADSRHHGSNGSEKSDIQEIRQGTNQGDKNEANQDLIHLPIGIYHGRDQGNSLPRLIPPPPHRFQINVTNATCAGVSASASASWNLNGRKYTLPKEAYRESGRWKKKKKKKKKPQWPLVPRDSYSYQRDAAAVWILTIKKAWVKE
jgi:hypothetical protein